MDGAFPPVLVWDRPGPGSVYGKGGVRVCELAEDGTLVVARPATGAELIAIQAGFIPHKGAK